MVIIPNWTDTVAIVPIPLQNNELRHAWGLDEHFVVTYSGNMGITHEFEAIKAAARPTVFIGNTCGEVATLLRERQCGSSVQRTLASQRRSDVLLLCWQTRFLSLFPALLRARFYRIPVVLWGHGYSKSPGAWRNWLRNLPVKLISKVFLYNCQTKDALTQAGLPADKLHVADNGLDSDATQAAIEYWQPYPAELQAFRKTHGLDSGPILIHVARLMADNRPDCTIRAIPQLLANFPLLKLVVIGRGQREQERLQELSGALQINSHLVWDGEVYEEHALCPWMLSANVLVYPATAGLGLIHAYNYGLPAPLRAPRSRHNPEAQALVQAYNGWLAKSLQSDDIADALTQMLKLPETQRQFSQAAKASVEQQFNIKAMAQSISSLVESLATTTITITRQ